MAEEQVLRAARDVQANGWKGAAQDLAEMEWDELIAAVVRVSPRLGMYIDGTHPRAKELIEKWPSMIQMALPPIATPMDLHPVLVKIIGEPCRVLWPENEEFEKLRARQEEFRREVGRSGIDRYTPPPRNL